VVEQIEVEVGASESNPARDGVSEAAARHRLRLRTAVVVGVDDPEVLDMISREPFQEEIGRGILAPYQQCGSW
jgi:hypothetical protein